MTQLFPDQLQALQNTLAGVPARAAAVLDIEIECVERFLDSVAEFVRTNAGPLSNYTYMLLFDGSISDGPRISLQEIVGSINKGNSLFYVDEELRLIKTAEGDATWIRCSKLTGEEHALGLRLEAGTYFYAILCGRVESQDDFKHPGTAAPKPSKWRRPMMEFGNILNDHKNACVDREQGFKYWYDKRNRILMVDPKSGSTEELFHHSLFWWLNHFVADKLTVYAETCGFGQGKTDIVVVTAYGSHVLELKWFGENQNRTTYGEKDIDKGLAQISQYLENNDDFLCGDLVVYDGRSRQEYEQYCQYDEEFRHNRCKPPRIIFLESEPPSKRAKRIVRERRREQND